MIGAEPGAQLNRVFRLGNEIGDADQAFLIPVVNAKKPSCASSAQSSGPGYEAQRVFGIPVRMPLQIPADLRV